jgi:hypothetical protein
MGFLCRSGGNGDQFTYAYPDVYFDSDPDGHAHRYGHVDANAYRHSTDLHAYGYRQGADAHPDGYGTDIYAHPNGDSFGIWMPDRVGASVLQLLQSHLGSNESGYECGQQPVTLHEDRVRECV